MGAKQRAEFHHHPATEDDPGDEKQNEDGFDRDHEVSVTEPSRENRYSGIDCVAVQMGSFDLYWNFCYVSACKTVFLCIWTFRPGSLS